MNDSNYPLKPLKKILEKKISNAYPILVYILAFLIYSIPALASNSTNTTTNSTAATLNSTSPTATTGVILRDNGLPTFDNASYPDSRNYTEVCWLTTHNAFANTVEGWKIHAQQNLSLQDQFNYGVRSFMIDLWWWTPLFGGKPYVSLGHGEPYTNYFQRGYSAPVPASEFFKQVKDWLNANNQAIITLHLESHLRLEDGYIVKFPNPIPKGSVPSDAINQLLTDAGLLNLVYRPAQDTIGQRGSDRRDAWKWPTLGEMRKSGKRLVIFSDRRTDDDPNGETAGRIPNRILNVGSYRETTYGVVDSQNCEMRGEGRDRGKIRPLFLLNRYYSSSFFPSITNFRDVNSCSNLKSQIEKCSLSEGILPNFIALDYVDQGDALAVVQAINKIAPAGFKKATSKDLDKICISSSPPSNTTSPTNSTSSGHDHEDL